MTSAAGGIIRFIHKIKVINVINHGLEIIKAEFTKRFNMLCESGHIPFRYISNIVSLTLVWDYEEKQYLFWSVYCKRSILGDTWEWGYIIAKCARELIVFFYIGQNTITALLGKGTFKMYLKGTMWIGQGISLSNYKANEKYDKSKVLAKALERKYMW